MADNFLAKLLLFGEYTVLSGSQALAVPLHLWKGHWEKQDPPGEHKDAPAFYSWMYAEGIANEEVFQSMKQDFHEGWNYEADIPMGCGVGSSGGYVAGIYKRYLAKKDANDFARVTAVMAQMENYFHGSSSGMDPLVSYTGNAIYRDETGTFHPVNDPGWPAGFKVYLLDTGTSRHTSDLVQAYKKEIMDPAFAQSIKTQLIPAVEHAIHFYLAGENSMLEECLNIISQFQRSHFSAMIPEVVRQQWDKLVVLPGVYVKLCGAGGGGYFLVVSANADTPIENMHGVSPLISIN